MIRALLPLLLVAAPPPPPGAGPCAPLQALSPDPEAAALLRSIADEELRRGAAGTAAAAYRKAAERDPRDAASRAALAQLCAADAGGDSVADGIARLDAGDAEGALRVFRAVHAQAPPTPELALLEGICHVELGQDAEAERLLRQAATSPAQRDAAGLFLGVVRLRTGDAAAAAALFDAAARAPGLAGTAGDLARLARRDGRLVLSLALDAAWDSNVTLAASDADPGPEADLSAAVSAMALWRPRGPVGPYLRAGAGMQKQRTLGDYDLGAVDGVAGWQARAGAASLAAEYGFEARWFGGDPYLTAHHLLAAVQAGRRTTLAATYAVRLEDYAGDYRDYSGLLHRAELRLSVPIGRIARAGVAYGGALDDARTQELSYLEHGPRAELWIGLGGRLRLGAEGGLALRRYARSDPSLGARRDDQYLDGLAAAEAELGAGLTARLAIQARRAYSNVAACEYEKLVPSIALRWMAGM